MDPLHSVKKPLPKSKNSKGLEQNLAQCSVSEFLVIVLMKFENCNSSVAYYAIIL